MPFLEVSGEKKLLVNYLVASRNAPHVSTLPSGLAVFAVEIAVFLLQELQRQSSLSIIQHPENTQPSSLHYYSEDGETVKKAARESHGHSIHGNIRSRIKWGSEQRGLVGGIPAHGRRVATG